MFEVVVELPFCMWQMPLIDQQQQRRCWSDQTEEAEGTPLGFVLQRTIVMTFCVEQKL